jgi:hypothetical protein
VGTNAERAAGELSDLIGRVKRGSLRVFGDWFGRPMDNIHVVRSAWADGDDLVITFDQGEELRITRPKDWEFSQDTLQVRHADRVVWRWYAYGRPRAAENLHTIEHWIGTDGTAQARSNEDWYTPLDPSTGKPAVELL